MAKSFTQLEAFTSSPSSMNAQRLLVNAAVEALPTSLLERLELTLRVVNWETDVVPGIGQDAQSVINSQTRGRFDIYIGLLGTYFGTPTLRAGSGTEEEFDFAYKSYSEDPESLRVLFYFKTGVDDAFSIDLEQLAKVKALKKRIGDSGVLYHDFKDDDALAKAISHHLQNLLERQWTGRQWKVDNTGQTIQTDTSVGAAQGGVISDQSLPGDNEEEETGILDIVVLGMEANEKLLHLLQGMTKTQTDFATAVQDLNSTALTGETTPQTLKWAVDELANILNVYSRGLATDLPSFKVLTDQVVSTFRGIVDLPQGILSVEDKSTSVIPDGLSALAEGIRAARLGLLTIRGHLNAAPGYTGRLKKAQRVATEILDQYAASMTIALGTLETLHIELVGRQKP